MFFQKVFDHDPLLITVNNETLFIPQTLQTIRFYVPALRIYIFIAFQTAKHTLPRQRWRKSDHDKPSVLVIVAKLLLGFD